VVDRVVTLVKATLPVSRSSCRIVAEAGRSLPLLLQPVGDREQKSKPAATKPAEMTRPSWMQNSRDPAVRDRG
jgi:hypothetical protein